ncbi:hypothetical protein R3W88_024361 [Solanum pinnatisectum]|uniref:Integrase core domain containing protein n=1 Tax=Solanum pinnatisectum TaxID=50273 RepID=A0AAV9M109_9SOLN|nr:hypothetical protein R3W88_024361 [Solanum pinnatisectum]
MQQPYVIATQLLDGMTKINLAWYTWEDQVSPLTFKLTKEQMEKDQERDQNMDKIITQLDILSKNVNGAGTRNVNVMGVGCVNPKEAKFEALSNEEVNFLANQGGGYRTNYPRDGEKDMYIPPHESQKPKDSKGGHSEDMLSRILHKVEGSNKILKEMKDDVSTLSQTVTSHSISIKELETQMGHISSYLNPRQQGGLPTDTMANPKNEV